MSTVAGHPLAIEPDDRQASEDLPPLLYEQLRRPTSQKMAADRPGQNEAGCVCATQVAFDASLKACADMRRA